MKRLTYILLLLFAISCKPVHEVVTHHEYITHTIDSVIYHDSTVVIPHETYTNIAWNYDTLNLETSLAKAQCWVDSIWLRGNISNKQQVIYKYIEVGKVRDSIVYEKVPEPYPVEVVKTKNAAWPIWLWAILSTLGLVGLVVLWIRKKFKLV